MPERRTTRLAKFLKALRTERTLFTQAGLGRVIDYSERAVRAAEAGDLEDPPSMAMLREYARYFKVDEAVLAKLRADAIRARDRQRRNRTLRGGTFAAAGVVASLFAFATPCDESHKPHCHHLHDADRAELPAR